MDDSSKPPLKTLAAAAVGGFGGAVLGVIAAGSLTGDGDNGNSGNGQGSNQTTETEVVEIVAAER